jgi:hypothetical protein
LLYCLGPSCLLDYCTSSIDVEDSGCPLLWLLTTPPPPDPSIPFLQQQPPLSLSISRFSPAAIKQQARPTPIHSLLFKTLAGFAFALALCCRSRVYWLLPLCSCPHTPLFDHDHDPESSTTTQATTAAQRLEAPTVYHRQTVQEQQHIQSKPRSQSLSNHKLPPR